MGLEEDWAEHYRAVIRTMTNYDMVENRDEDYYARQYLHWILADLSSRYPHRRLRILDLGCGQGRLSLPLARWCAEVGGVVEAVDLTPSAVGKARAHASSLGLANVLFHEADLLSFIQRQPDASADVVLLVEVTFFLPTYRQVLLEMARTLRQEGVLFVAFRPQYYDLLQTIRAWKWDRAEMVLREREGYLWGEPVWFTWQTPDDIHRLCEEVGLRLVKLRGIGVCSGIQEDPLSAIVRPSQLPPEDQERLMAIECAAAEAYPSCGRYILATADKVSR